MDAAVTSVLPAPRRATAWAALVYAVATLLLAYPALGGLFLINARSDQYLAGYAFRQFAAQSLRAGHGFPQWNPYLQGGMPYIAAMHGDIFYPTFLLRMIMPTDAAMTWEFVIHLFLCGLFTFLFLRAWRFGFYAALIGGLAYMLGGSIAGLASPGHDGKLFVSTLTPLGLLLITRGVRDARPWAWGAFAVTVGLAFLSPHPQLFEYFLILSGFFTLYVAFGEHPGFPRLSREVAVRRVAYALGCVALGCLIGAVQFVPALIEYRPWSPRAGGHDWATATSYSYPIEEILNWYWPQFSGILDNYWGRNGIHLHSDYFGVVALMLAGASFGTSERRGFRRFWLAAFVVSLVWAIGGYTPFYHVVMAVVPMTKYLRAPSTMIFITALSVAVLAAMGTERLLARRTSPKYPLIWLLAGGVFALLMSVGGYTALANAVANSVAGGFPAEARGQVVDSVTQRAQPNIGDAIFGVWRSFLIVALTAGVMWGFLTDRINPRAALFALVALITIDLWSIERLYWIFSPPARTLFASDPAIDAINADIAKTQPGRVLNLAGGQGLTTELGRLDRTFSGDKLMVHGVRIPVGYHGNELGMYQQLLGADSVHTEDTPQFWRHENVQYLYTGLDPAAMAQAAAQLKMGPFVKLAGPVRNASGSMVYAYKVPVDNPPAWLASAIVKASPDQALATVIDPRFDPATVAIIDTSAKAIQGVPISALPAPATTRANVRSFGPGAIGVELTQPAQAGQALVVSENYFPGWRATVDGKPAPVGRADFNLLGVALPQGARSVELRFDDSAYLKGRVITLVALLAAVLLWVGGAVVARRQPTAPASA
jgi:hypothetical protein